MSTWYRIERYNVAITPIEVVKETAQQVVYVRTDTYGATPRSTEIRAFKGGEFFQTFQEAKEYLIQRYEREKQNALDQVSRVSQKLKQARELMPISEAVSEAIR